MSKSFKHRRLSTLTFLCFLMAASSFSPTPSNASTDAARLDTWSVDVSVGALLDDPGARSVLVKYLPDVVASPQVTAARALPLRALKPYVPAMSDELLAALDAELAKVPKSALVRPATVAPSQSALQLKTVLLWERGAPGALGERMEDKPTLTVVTPIPEQATGAAVIVVPGGGYRALASNHEGRQVADWFAARGVTAFVLSYRLTTFGYRHPTQKLDGERAVRWVRAHATELGLDAHRIGMIGFSAGGHLTAMVATQGAGSSPTAADVIDRVSSRPNFVVLWYPGLLPMERRSELLGNEPILREQVLAMNYVSKETPPTFIFHTSDDELVPPSGVLAFHSALLAAGVSTELHVFEKGRHGMGFALADDALRAAPLLLENWLRRHEVLTPRPLQH